MNKHVRVNIRTVVNMTGIRHERRDGRDKIIVPSATLPDGVVMNNIRYPAEEIAKSFMSLNRKPAPLGHPTINGVFVSASDPEGINIGWIGAHNENVRQEGGRVLLDKVIDVARANESVGGRSVLEAIEKGEPIHTSTGLMCDLEAAAEDEKKYKYSARNIDFDHDAILLGEEGAATPAQGVGMMVNAGGEQTEIEVINSVMDDFDREVGYAVDSAFRAVERQQRAPMLERIKTAIMEAVTGTPRETSANTGDAEMDKATFDALSAKVDGLVEAQAGIGETIANAVAAVIKPLTDSMALTAANQKAKDDAELDVFVKQIVKSNLLDEATAKGLSMEAARALANVAKPGTAAPINGVFNGVTAPVDEFVGYDLNAAMGGTDTKAVN